MRIDLNFDSGGIGQITVFGELESKKDELLLLRLMEENNCKHLHITFVDANVLGARIIEKLNLFQESVCIKLFVHKAHLFSYLYTLGIKCTYITSKPIESCKDEKENDTEVKETILFLQQLKQQYGYDYTQYQPESIARRIKACMIKENCKSFARFKEAVLRDEQMFEQLFLHFSVNTTAFFRNPEVFYEIKNKILPYLSTFSHIKIWCAGCSTGQEAYSLAILLDEAGLLKKTQIYATDMNPYVIEEGKNGLFTIKDLEKNINDYRIAGGMASFAEYFSFKGEYMEITDKLKQSILFFQHSLDGKGILNEFQLILCRNVLIYFSSALQGKILKNFADSLAYDGFLNLGKSEGILHNNGYRYFYEYHKQFRIYKKKELT